MNLRKHQLYVGEDHSVLFNISSGNISINPQGKSV